MFRMSNRHLSCTSWGTTPGGCAQAPGAADRQDPRAKRIVQATQRAQAPEELILAIDHNVIIIDTRHREPVAMLAQISAD